MKKELNIKARKRIAKIAETLNLDSCELRFKGCMKNFGIAPAHRHRREWYKNDWKLLSDYEQWVAACQYCHSILDDRSKTSQEKFDKIFNKLRGKEK
ncbi:MAG TPA: hypothetical protein ENJ27_00975 [Candidatus Moranbacteria bacterium]|nr:hypothetical protein [Candidatus Moranbacteria bacterium]